MRVSVITCTSCYLQTRHGLQDAVAAQLGAAEAIDLTGQDLAGNEGVFADEPNEDAGPLDDYASQLHAFEIQGAHVSLAADM